MWIIRSSDLRAVVLVKGRGVFSVAIPERLSSDEVLELASLVLSTSEYEELRLAVEPCDERADAVSTSYLERSLERPCGLMTGRGSSPSQGTFHSAANVKTARRTWVQHRVLPGPVHGHYGQGNPAPTRRGRRTTFRPGLHPEGVAPSGPPLAAGAYRAGRQLR